MSSSLKGDALILSQTVWSMRRYAQSPGLRTYGMFYHDYMSAITRLLSVLSFHAISISTRTSVSASVASSARSEFV